jgi:hypothetical protein
MQPWMLVIAIATLGTVFGFLGMRADILRRYRATKALSCPETGKDVGVRLDTRYAVLTTAALAAPKLRVAQCSLWPKRQACGQGCLREPGNQSVLHITSCPYSRCKAAA